MCTFPNARVVSDVAMFGFRPKPVTVSVSTFASLSVSVKTQSRAARALGSNVTVNVSEAPPTIVCGAAGVIA